MDHLWQIDLLGGLRACGTERTITRFRTQKSGLLLAYLALRRSQAHPREVLAELLWPGSDAAGGRLNLRVELASLRRQLEPPGFPRGSVLVTDYAAVQLNPAAVRTDVAAFEAALQEAKRAADRARRIALFRGAVELYRGELLPGCVEEWASLERGRLTDLYGAALRELSGLLHATGDPEAAIEVAHRAAAADPLCEEARFDLIRLYAAVQRPADALAQYRELERMLRDQLGVEPDEEIRRFAAGLEGNGPPVPAGAPGSNHRPAAPSPPPPPPTAAPEGAGAAAPVGPAPPRLPLTLTRFFGREAELACLEELLGSSAPRSLEPGAAAVPIQNPNAPARGPAPRFAPLPEIQNRLVTLTGPGGSGKTRLAIEAARRLAPSFAMGAPPRSGGPWVVPLADLSDPALIPEAIAAALLLPRSPDVAPLEQLALFLGDRRCLLVLDNLEHLLEGGREIVRSLLERMSNLVCLVSSRQKLDLEGERELYVPPLPVPVASGQWSVASQQSEPELATDRGPQGRSRDETTPLTLGGPLTTVAACPSIALFIDRAQAARPDFQLTDRNAAAVVELCQRLAGLPLAIELAAAWAQTVTPGQMLAQLDRSGPLLVSRRKETPPRHRSLAAAIDWSYRRLEPRLQRFFARLSIFRGGWSLEAAGAVCTDEHGSGERAGGRLPATPHNPCSSVSICGSKIQNPEGALWMLTALHDRSLVVAEECGEAMRFRLLEPVREFAREQLTEAEWDALGERHTDCYLALAEEADRRLFGPEHGRWLERLKAEEANLQAALERCSGVQAFERSGVQDRTGPSHPSEHEPVRDARRSERLNAAEFALRLAAALSRYWQLRGQLREGRQWLERVLAASPDAAPALRARALFGTAALAYLAGDTARGEALCEEALRYHDRLGDHAGPGAAVRPLTAPVFLHTPGLFSPDQPWLLEALRRAREEPGVQAFLLALEAGQARGRGDYDSAAALLEKSGTIYRQLEDRRGKLVVRYLRGSVAANRGDYATTRRCWEGCLADYQELGDEAGISKMMGGVAYALFHLGDTERGEALMNEALASRRRMGDRRGIADCLWQLGNLALLRGQSDQAAVLLEESLEMRRAIGRAGPIADTLVTVGMAAEARDDRAGARAAYEEAVALRRQGTDQLDLAEALHQLGCLALAEGRCPKAERLLQESLALSRHMRNEGWAAHTLRALGGAAVYQGDFETAEARLRESLAMYVRQGNRLAIAEWLELLADLRFRQQRPEEAAAAIAAAAAIRDALDRPVPAKDRAAHGRFLAALRAALGPERFAAIWEAARCRPMDAVLAEALPPTA